MQRPGRSGLHRAACRACSSVSCRVSAGHLCRVGRRFSCLIAVALLASVARGGGELGEQPCCTAACRDPACAGAAAAVWPPTAHNNGRVLWPCCALTSGPRVASLLQRRIRPAMFRPAILLIALLLGAAAPSAAKPARYPPPGHCSRNTVSPTLLFAAHPPELKHAC